jgi:hypothetical protein
MRTTRKPDPKNGDDRPKRKPHPTLQRFAAAFEDLPASEFKNFPRDYVQNFEHYLYGAPKR